MKALAETRCDTSGHRVQEAVPSCGACGIKHSSGPGQTWFKRRSTGNGSPPRHLPLLGAHQTHAAAVIITAHQLERVEIVRTPPQAPVKAWNGAMGARTNPTDRLTSHHATTDSDLRYHGLVRRPEGAVANHYHAAARELSGEADRSVGCRAHRGTWTGSQVHPAVTRGPAHGGRAKVTDNGGWVVQRPDALLGSPRQR